MFHDRRAAQEADSSKPNCLERIKNMRSSAEDALRLFQKWKSESARIFVSSTGRVTFWFIGRVVHDRSEVTFEIPGLETDAFCVSVNLLDATFNFADPREEIVGWTPRITPSGIECALQARLDDGRLILFAELKS